MMPHRLAPRDRSPSYLCPNITACNCTPFRSSEVPRFSTEPPPPGCVFFNASVDFEQGIYSGQVTASILVDDLRVGDTLVVAYSVTGQNPVFAGKFVDAASWDQSYKTALRRVTLNYPTERNIAWRLIGSPKAKAITPTETMQNGMRKLLFEERTLPRIDQNLTLHLTTTTCDGCSFPNLRAGRKWPTGQPALPGARHFQ